MRIKDIWHSLRLLFLYLLISIIFSLIKNEKKKEKMDLQRVVMFPHRADIPHYQHYTIISYKELKQFFIAPPAAVSEVLEALVREDFLHVYSA